MGNISKTRLYSIFSGMKQRCYNEKSTSYKYYGGKGITICDEWMGENGLFNFFEWALNNNYEEHLTIDRIDSDGPYSPENCRWVTASDNTVHAMLQKPNPNEKKKPGINFTIKSMLWERKMTQVELAKVTGVRQPTISALCLGQSKHIPVYALERICEILDCQPGDLMEYIKEEE